MRVPARVSRGGRARAKEDVIVYYLGDENPRGIFARLQKGAKAGMEEELRGSFTVCIKVDRSTGARAFVSRNGTGGASQRRLYFRNLIRPFCGNCAKLRSCISRCNYTK